MSIVQLTNKVNVIVHPPATATERVVNDVIHGTSTSEFFNRCFICQKYIGDMVGIYIYKDMSFCSTDCRNKEMDKDTDELHKNQAVKMNKKKRSRKNSTPMRAVFFIE